MFATAGPGVLSTLVLWLWPAAYSLTAPQVQSEDHPSLSAQGCDITRMPACFPEYFWREGDKSQWLSIFNTGLLRVGGSTVLCNEGQNGRPLFAAPREGWTVKLEDRWAAPVCGSLLVQCECLVNIAQCAGITCGPGRTAALSRKLNYFAIKRWI